ncbi:MAG: hypothetical protein R2911_35460 [Caldilineaceae bacterium]
MSGRASASDRPDLLALMQRAAAVGDNNPLPLHMANGNLLQNDVAAGSLIAANNVAAPEGSVLWSLRREQDAHMLKMANGEW